MEMIKLPKGVKVEIDRKVWRGEIPACICPERFKPKQPTGQKRNKDKGEADE
jgi:hypothetical protein